MGRKFIPQKYRMSEEAADALSGHVDRICERWGVVHSKWMLFPNEELKDNVFGVETPDVAEAFAAAVRDTRHYIEVHGYNHEPDDADYHDPATVKHLISEDRKLVKHFKRVEATLEEDLGAIPTMEAVKASVLKEERRTLKAAARVRRNDAAFKVGCLAVFMVVALWGLSLCT